MPQPNQFVDAEGNRKPDAPETSENQFTTGKRSRHDQATKDRMRAEHAARKLQAILEDEASTRDQVIAAAKALLPYGKSTYASVIQQEENEWETMSEEEQVGFARALFIAQPQLLRALHLVWEPGYAPEAVQPVDKVA